MIVGLLLSGALGAADADADVLGRLAERGHDPSCFTLSAYGEQGYFSAQAAESCRSECALIVYVRHYTEQPWRLWWDMSVLRPWQHEVLADALQESIPHFVDFSRQLGELLSSPTLPKSQRHNLTVMREAADNIAHLADIDFVEFQVEEGSDAHVVTVSPKLDDFFFQRPDPSEDFIALHDPIPPVVIPKSRHRR